LSHPLPPVLRLDLPDHPRPGGLAHRVATDSFHEHPVLLLDLVHAVILADVVVVVAAHLWRRRANSKSQTLTAHEAPRAERWMRHEVGVSDEPYMPIHRNGCAYSRPGAEGYTSVMQAPVRQGTGMAGKCFRMKGR